MYEPKNIAFYDIAINEGNGWFFNIGYNAIFQVDLETGKLKLEAFISGKNWRVQELFRGIAYFNEKLYLAPWKGSRLCIYDLKKREFNFLDLDLERYGEEKNYHLFKQVEVIENNIYFFPGRFHAIVKLNPLDNNLEYIDSWYEELSASWDEDKRGYLIFNKVIVGNNGWCTMSCWRSNVIFRINILSGEFSIVESGINGQFSDIVEAEERYIGAFKNSKLIYEISNKGAVEIPLEAEKDDVCLIHKYGSNICIISFPGTRMDIYDLNTYENKMSYQFPDTVSDSQRWIKYKSTSFCNKKIDDHRLVLYLRCSGEILIINMANCLVRSIIPVMDDGTEKSVKEYLSEHFNKTLFSENSNYGFKDFLETLNAIS